MQFRYLVFGLLLAALIVGFNWANSLPGIPPVRLDDGRDGRVPEQATATADVQNAAGDTRQRFRLDDGGSEGSPEGGDDPASSANPLPLLNESDEWLRQQLKSATLPWLAESELVRTAATVLENASRGEVPRKFLQFLAPEGRYQVRRIGELVQVDPESYERYTPFVQTLEQFSAERAASTFELVEPLLGEAVTELGETAVSPRELAFAALEIALDTPRSDATAALKQPKVMFTYADEELEKLRPIQKQLLRMGPRNLQRIRLWLEDFGLALAGGSVPAGTSAISEELDIESDGP